MRDQGHTEVLVIGGGIIGLTIAYYLNRAGRKVCLIEKETVGSDAASSYGNCGLLYFSDLPPLCQPGAVADALVRMTRRTSPLYIKPELNLPKLMWLLKFAAKCNYAHFRHAVAARHALFTRSRELYVDLFKMENIACQWEQQGVLLVFKQRALLNQYQKINAVLRPYGAAATRLSRAQLLQKEPALADDVCGAWYHPADSHIQPETLLNELKTVLIARGVTIIESCTLRRLDVSSGTITAAITTRGKLTADQYVLAAGVWSSSIARQLGVRLPVQPGKGYSITMARPRSALRFPCYFWERAVVATPWQDGCRLGGTMEFSGLNRDLDTVRIDNLKSAATAYLREPLMQPVLERWVGLRPMCSDDLPIIGALPRNPNLYLATGHGMIGMTAATGTAELVAHLITGEKTAIDPAPYSPERFLSGGIPCTIA
jgi:D-amino-acid dehydrogenase